MLALKKKIAITGGVAAGKTTVCQIFAKNGAYVLNADQIVHHLLSPNTEAGKQVIRLLGPDILTAQQIDRKKIAQKVFGHPERLRALEKILHPIVFDEIEKHYQTVKENPKIPFFVAEVPLLYETEQEHYFDIVISVIADETICKSRFRKDDEYERRMERQLPPAHKANKSHFVIINNGTLQELENQVNQLMRSPAFNESRR